MPDTNAARLGVLPPALTHLPQSRPRNIRRGVTESPRPPVIQITVDGEPAITIGQAAARHGRDHTVMRVLLHSLGVPKVAELDGRPLYAQAAVDKAVKAMPGKRTNHRKRGRNRASDTSGLTT
jgi:hypothetical protein